ncbi:MULTISPECIES: RNA polymerase factor sigma-54 [unclassified Sporosarcina]|uniref:RNA polymerase factor sigma-54 n=1 Tax=unclassified Sporosarcina TaxID=2647733 RepID=UPI000C16ECF1|nr:MULTISPECIES: RNA polymerase factor sigma-54 [unclassified Sporosarcina]PIC98609.1 RNA polymerase sigma-54 factor [Sporosarcina sp. P29]PID06040.1 RNA polymerase sigma-54 factor [Sporosarcina sp. P30]PID09234.1 RNA polymerase sigma-54 factor [Sporosarcina sp. P31]PID12532.1 RNA polymerase sigma-54 factor [Sporosarcina sp. P32b]
MSLQQKQELSLRMTTELRQAIELLQLSTYDLELYIREKELENPVIEIQEAKRTDSFQERQSLNYSRQETDSTEWAKQQEVSMRDQMLRQVEVDFKDPKTKQLLKTLIHSLDDNGYLCAEMHAVENVDKGIELLQQIGPPGIGSRTLQECLLLQVRSCEACPELMETFISEYLPYVAERKWQQIANGMNSTLAHVNELHEFLLTLHPRPCPELGHSETEFMMPDVIVEEKHGKLSFHLNDRDLPKIGLRKEYVSSLKGTSDLSSYLRDYHKQAQWLLTSIEQRRNTIIRIVTDLLEKQDAFFREGRKALQPMTMKEVADRIDMHESTISRTVSNKVIQTPAGTFEMRSLFTSKLAAQDGDSVSQSAVKASIQSLIAKEDKRKPLSDQKIVDLLLKEQGITISRRTVSKYREALHILSSSKRKSIL